jgi:N-acetylmuramoyl-L-alanine amidase
LLSIHADSCQYINELATGFKVARVQDSRVPDQEDRLVACVTEQYRSATGLRFHANTVTFDMTRYHAFYEIDVTTPAAIIEIGFMNLDRAILVEQPDVVAKGIVDGLRCFIEGETSRMELDGGN